MYYKLVQVCFMKNWRKHFEQLSYSKLGCYCMPQLLYIVKCSYKLGYVLQNRAEVTTE